MEGDKMEELMQRMKQRGEKIVKLEEAEMEGDFEDF